MAQDDSIDLQRAQAIASKAYAQIAPALFTATQHLSQLQVYDKQLLELSNRISASLEPWAAIQKQITASMQPWVDAQNRFAAMFAPMAGLIGDWVRATEEFHTNLDERHSSEGLSLSPYFREQPVNIVAKLFRDRSKPAIAIYSEFFSIEENLNDLLDCWNEHDVFARRSRILRDALQAHRRGEHTLSIPVFLTQMEGILSELLLVGSHKQFNSRLQSITPAEPNIVEKDCFSMEPVIEALSEQIFNSKHKTRVQGPYPNRHRVVHGYDVHYFEDPYASVRCILILDLLRLKEFDLAAAKHPAESVLVE